MIYLIKLTNTNFIKVGYTTNISGRLSVYKNTIPNETESPFKTSGIRLGSPAMTTRGFKEEDFIKVGKIISKALRNIDNEEVYEELRKETKELTDKYPLYE